MDVTIIGAGNMGRGLGTRLVAGGNQVKILDTDPGGEGVQHDLRRDPRRR